MKLSGNVLIVDDSSVARKILRDTLENMGLYVIEAVDGKQAMDILKDFLSKTGDKPVTDYINLIISDVDMPVMNGIEYYNKASEKYPNIRDRFLFFTGYADEERLHLPETLSWTGS